MKPQPKVLLQSVFGFPAFRPGQEDIVDAVLAGRNVLAIMPTGGGKSLCFQLPALCRSGVTVVISPLIALMRDQVRALRATGVNAGALTSGNTDAETEEVFAALDAGEMKLLYMAPERLASPATVPMLRRIGVSLIAVDEAHCVSQWGHDFRPDYLRIGALRAALEVPLAAFTATADEETRGEIVTRLFGGQAPETFLRGFDRPNIHLAFAVKDHPRDQILTFAAARRSQSGIVYCGTRAKTEVLAQALREARHSACHYHGGMDPEERRRVEIRFQQEDGLIVVATIAFGMGIDKADIRSVFHFNLPKTLENYQQEIGRAGRDGQPSHCEMLACADDLTVLQNFILGDTPEEQALRHLVDHLLRQGAEFDISRYDISRTTDIRPLVLETVITYLEKEKILEPAGLFYATMQIAFRHPEDRVVAGHTADRQKFLKNLFASGKRGTRLLTLDLEASAEKIGESRERILKALGYLEDAGDIEIKPSGLRHKFRLLAGAKERSPHEIATWLHGLFTSREKQDLARLDGIVEFASAPGCSVRRLLNYFGEKTESDCGHCGRCQGEGAAKLPQSAEGDISQTDVEAIRNLRAEGHAALRAKRQLARFLCGISSPAVSRDRLTRHDAFARLESVPFAKVLEYLDACL